MESNEHSQLQPEPGAIEGERRFAACLKRIRLSLNSKQVWLSEAIGCSDAAVSFWESGARVPTPRSLGRLLAALAREGTPPSDLLELRRMWCSDYMRRGGRRGPHRI